MQCAPSRGNPDAHPRTWFQHTPRSWEERAGEPPRVCMSPIPLPSDWSVCLDLTCSAIGASKQSVCWALRRRHDFCPFRWYLNSCCSRLPSLHSKVTCKESDRLERGAGRETIAFSSIVRPAYIKTAAFAERPPDECADQTCIETIRFSWQLISSFRIF